jgi:hypothetical protein
MECPRRQLVGFVKKRKFHLASIPINTIHNPTSTAAHPHMRFLRQTNRQRQGGRQTDRGEVKSENYKR